MTEKWKRRKKNVILAEKILKAKENKKFTYTVFISYHSLLEDFISATKSLKTEEKND